VKYERVRVITILQRGGENCLAPQKCSQMLHADIAMAYFFCFFNGTFTTFFLHLFWGGIFPTFSASFFFYFLYSFVSFFLAFSTFFCLFFTFSTFLCLFFVLCWSGCSIMVSDYVYFWHMTRLLCTVSGHQIIVVFLNTARLLQYF
jgi:hypothetical protein